ncbi:MAG: O-antigen ligase family protein, partial [Planctomycetes bacterium]|nr:O-antigen ligase family protein [Planctomycetota bacterium]
IGAFFIAMSEWRRITFKTLVIISLFLVILGGLVGKQVFDRASSVVRMEEDDAIHGRLSYLKTGLAIFMDYPIFGVGPNNYRLATALPEYSEMMFTSEWEEMVREKYHRSSSGRAAHNAYMEILGDLGGLGFLAFISLLGVSVLSITRARRIFGIAGHAAKQSLCTGILASMIVFMVNAFFLSVDELLIPWMMIGISGSLWIIAAKPILKAKGTTAHGK